MSILDTKKILGYAQSYARNLLRRHDEDAAAHPGHTGDVEAHGLEDTGWIEATLQNGWSNYGLEFERIAYRRKNGIVYIKGFSNGLGTKVAETVIFDLPPGFRPEADKHQDVMIDVATTDSIRIKIQATGAVKVNNIPGCNWCSFANISFPADN